MNSILKIFYVALFVVIYYLPSVAKAEVTPSNIESEDILVFEIIRGNDAKEACTKLSDADNSNEQLRQVNQCMSNGAKVVLKDETYKNVAEFCFVKANHEKYGFTNENKCSRKFIEVINGKWLVQ